MKQKKLLGVLLVMSLCMSVTVPMMYGQEGINDEREITSLVVEQVKPQTWQVEAKKVCENLGLSPVLLPPEAQCTDGYIGRLKVIGLIDLKEVIDETAVMSVEAWQRLMDEMQRYKLGSIGTSVYGEQLMKISPTWEEVKIGPLNRSKSVLRFGDVNYQLYEIANTSFVRVADLRNMGLDVICDTSGTAITLTESMGSVAADGKVLKGDAYTQKNTCSIGNLRTYSIICQDETLVPVRALGSLFDVKIEEGLITLENPNLAMGGELLIKEQSLLNTTQHTLSLLLTSYYWDGKNIQTLTQTVNELEAGQEMGLPWDYYSLLSGQMTYITTLVDEVSYTNEAGDRVIANDQRYDQYGQNNLAYFKAYENGRKAISTASQEVNELFPSSIIMGTMRYATHGLAKGDKVEVWAADSGKNYKVISDGKKITVPWDSVSIPSNPPINKQAATKEQIETYINSKGFTSKTNYLVWTDLYRQRTYVFQKQDERWVLHKEMLCSTGNNRTPTPRGEFTLTSYVPAFGMNKGYMCKNAVGIFEDYLYHSVMFDKTGSYELTGVGKLGNQASAGCIRLSYEDSIWFYKNMPLGTKVWIN